MSAWHLPLRLSAVVTFNAAGVGPELMAVLEGESLFNDASSITLFEVQPAEAGQPHHPCADPGIGWTLLAVGHLASASCFPTDARSQPAALRSPPSRVSSIMWYHITDVPGLQVFLGLVARLEKGKHDMSFGATALDLANRIVFLSVGKCRCFVHCLLCQLPVCTAAGVHDSG